MAILTRRAGALASLLALAGCGAATAPIHAPDASVAVQSVLATGSDTVAVLLTRFDPRALDERFQRLAGATVRIMSGGDTLRLGEAPAGFHDCLGDPAGTLPAGRGCYASVVPGGIRAGARYDLEITLPGGGVVRGATSPPAAPVIVAPAAGYRVTVPTPENPTPGGRSSIFPVRWTMPAGAGRIEIALVRPTAYSGGRVLSGADCRIQPGPLPEELASQDSVLHQVVGAFCSRGTEAVRWDSISVQMVVTAYDSAYARYAREIVATGSVRESRASAGVENAYGVFGSAASASRRLTLVPASN